MTQASENPTPSQKRTKKSGAPGEDSESTRSSNGDMPLFQDMPPRHIKGTRRLIFAGLALIIALPVVIGLLFYLLRSLVTNPQ